MSTTTIPINGGIEKETRSMQRSISTVDSEALNTTSNTASFTAVESVTGSTILLTMSSLPAPTLPSNNTENNNTLILYIALVIGLIVLVLILAVVVGLYFMRVRYYSKKQNIAVPTELKDMKKENDGPVTVDSHKHRHHLGVVNPNLFLSEVSNPLSSHHEYTAAYSEVDSGKVIPHVGYRNGDNTAKRNAQTKIIDANGDEFIGVYDVVTSDNTDESPAHALSNKTSNDGIYYDAITSAASDEVPTTEPAYICPHPESNDITQTMKGEGTGRPARLYSGIKIREAPEVPTKSSDLAEYLDTCSAFNVGIHSEPINPSDFTCSKVEEEATDPLFYGPIYPATVTLPECSQQPADVTSDNIMMKKELRTGQFGEVMLADTNGLSLKDMQLSKTDADQNISILVAVKKLKQHPSQSQREAFSREVKFTSRLKHPNVLRLLGVCFQEPTFVMMEYMKEGDLSQFLQRHSEIITTPSNNTQIATSTVVYMASQIASAMKYLAALKFIHRDLATRNCLVSRNNQIKVADLGVNMKLYQSDYYCIRGNKFLPIRWMATECFSGKFSEKSDVWAFGVTMWELFTLAKRKPYPHLSDEEVIHNALKREYRQFPSRPAACPQPVYEIMEQCWVVNMQQRATFKKLLMMLQITL